MMNITTYLKPEMEINNDENIAVDDDVTWSDIQ